MKPFHTQLGAVAFLEQNAQGPTGVLVTTGNLKTHKLTTYRVEFDKVFQNAPRYKADQGWAIVAKEPVHA